MALSFFLRESIFSDIRADRVILFSRKAEMMPESEAFEQVTDEGKVVRKAEVIASFESSARHWDEAQSDELQVRVYGEAAVVTGRWQARGVNAGQVFDYAARYVSMWVWRDSRWQMVSDQSTEIR